MKVVSDNEEVGEPKRQVQTANCDRRKSAVKMQKKQEIAQYTATKPEPASWPGFSRSQVHSSCDSYLHVYQRALRLFTRV